MGSDIVPYPDLVDFSGKGVSAEIIPCANDQLLGRVLGASLAVSGLVQHPVDIELHIIGGGGVVPGAGNVVPRLGGKSGITEYGIVAGAAPASYDQLQPVIMRSEPELQGVCLTRRPVPLVDYTCVVRCRKHVDPRLQRTRGRQVQRCIIADLHVVICPIKIETGKGAGSTC